MRRILALAVIAIAAGVSLLPVAAQEVTVVVEFDPGAAELPEGVAVDSEGNVYVGMNPTGEIKKLTPSGDVSTFASLPGSTLLGLAFDQAGHLYGCLASGDPETHGIWRISPDGSAEQFASLDAAGTPNWPAFDRRGNLYVSDTLLGQIWRIDPQGEISVWKADPLLLPAPEPGPLGSFGANGIAFDADQSYLYVANSDMSRIVRIPLETDGSAGTAEVFLEDAELLGVPDGIAFDDQGNLYVAVIDQDRLVVISSEGVAVTPAEGEPLQNPASLAFGAGDQARELFITNFGVLRAVGITPGTLTPGLLKITVANPGILVQAASAEGLPPAGSAGRADAGNGLAGWWLLAAAGAALLATGGVLRASRRAGQLGATGREIYHYMLGAAR